MKEDWEQGSTNARTTSSTPFSPTTLISAVASSTPPEMLSFSGRVWWVVEVNCGAELVDASLFRVSLTLAILFEIVSGVAVEWLTFGVAEKCKSVWCLF